MITCTERAYILKANVRNKVIGKIISESRMVLVQYATRHIM